MFQIKKRYLAFFICYAAIADGENTLSLEY